MDKKILILPLLALLLTACNQGDQTSQDSDISTDSQHSEPIKNFPTEMPPASFQEFKDFNKITENKEFLDNGISFSSSKNRDFYKLHRGQIESAIISEYNSNQVFAFYNQYVSEVTLKPNTFFPLSFKDNLENIVNGFMPLELIDKPNYSIRYGKGNLSTSNEIAIEEGFSLESSSGTGMTSFEESIVLAEREIRDNSKDITINFDETFPTGFYRNVISADIDIYQFAVVDHTYKVIYYFYDYLINNIKNEIDYSENNDFIIRENNRFQTVFDPNKLAAPSREFISSYDDESQSFIKGFDGGTGRKDNPYVIKGITKDPLTQFKLIANNLSNHFSVETDIDFANYNVSGIESIIRGNFTGSIDFHDHTLKNLSLNCTSGNVHAASSYSYELQYKVALFEELSGTIRNLIINNFSIYFSPYHDSSSWYGFGFICGCGDGTIENVTINNSRLETNRGSSRSGCIAAQFAGDLTRCNVNNCYIMSNGDAGGLVGQFNGNINLCEVKSCEFYYYFVNEEERSVGGLVGYMFNKYGNDASIYNSHCTYSNFKHHFYKKGLFDKARNPKNGEVIGHGETGSVYRIGFVSGESCHNTKSVEYGNTGKYYYAVGWGWAGKVDSNFKVLG